MAEILLEIKGLEKRFESGGGFLGKKKTVVHAINGIDLTLMRGETLALVGESGCGKSTAARLIMAAHRPTSGTLRLHHGEGEPLAIETLSKTDRKALWRNVQLIFQDPFTSLNPRMSVRQTLAEPLRNFGLTDQMDKRISDLLDAVGLSPKLMNRYPHAFSGGQRQRIGIARALAVSPSLVIGDEPVSALDVSVAAQVVNLFADLKARFGLTYLLITHDLSLVRHSADRVAVMYLGRIVEEAPTAALFAAPRHPYSAALLSAAPNPFAQKQARIVLKGEVASARTPPPGCPFHPRCAHGTDRCRSEAPKPVQIGSNRRVACHHPLETVNS